MGDTPEAPWQKIATGKPIDDVPAALERWKKAEGACLERCAEGYFLSIHSRMDGAGVAFGRPGSKPPDASAVRVGEITGPGGEFRGTVETALLTEAMGTWPDIHHGTLVTLVLHLLLSGRPFYSRDPEGARELRLLLGRVSFTVEGGEECFRGAILEDRILPGPPPWGAPKPPKLREEKPEALAEKKPSRVPKKHLPARIPQPTGEEPRSMGQALADAGILVVSADGSGPNVLNWTHVPSGDGESAAMVWRRDKRQSITCRLEPTACDVWGIDISQTLLRIGGMRGVLAAYLAVGTLLQSDEESLPWMFDEVIDTLHLPTRDEKGNRCRKPVYDEYGRLVRGRRQDWHAHLFGLALSWQHFVLVGERRHEYTRDGQKEHITHEGHPLLLVDTRYLPPQRGLPGFGTLPKGVDLVRGKLLREWRGDSRVLTHFGSLRALAELPTGKPAAALAQRVGLALHQLWRQGAKRGYDRRQVRMEYVSQGDGKSKARYLTDMVFTRRELCEVFPGHPDLLSMAKGTRPQSAIKCWNDAIGMLRPMGMVGFVHELTPLKKTPGYGVTGWQDEWYSEQRIAITPPESELDALIELRGERKRIAARAERAAKARVNAAKTRRRDAGDQ